MSHCRQGDAQGAELFFATIVKKTAACSTLIDRDSRFLNERCAALRYRRHSRERAGKRRCVPTGSRFGVKNFVRVSLAGTSAGGLGTQAGILTVHFKSTPARGMASIKGSSAIPASESRR